MISRNSIALTRRNYRLKSNLKDFSFWSEIFVCLKFIGFYNPESKCIAHSDPECNGWRVMQIIIFGFQCFMITLSVISFFWFDMGNGSLFHVLDGMLPILMMINGAAYQAVMISKSNSFSKLLIHMIDVSRKINVKLDYKLKTVFYIIVLLPIVTIILKATAFFCHMNDMERSNHTSNYYSTKPYLYFTGIYIVLGNSQPAYYVVVIIAQIVIVFLSIFGPLLVEFLIYNIVYTSIEFFRKSRSNLQRILKRSKAISLREFEEWMEVYLSVSRLAEEIDHNLSPTILVFSVLVPLITGIFSYEATQISSMMPFLSWQSKIVPTFMIVLHSVRMIAMSFKGQEFIEKANGLWITMTPLNNEWFPEEAKFVIEEILLKEKYFPISLSAYEFISLSKSFLATVIGTILTYLIILVQLTPEPCKKN